MKNQSVQKYDIDTLCDQIRDLSPTAALEILIQYPDDVAGKLLAHIPATYGFKILNRFPQKRARQIAQNHPSSASERWLASQQYPEESLGRLMEKPGCVLQPDTLVSDAIEEVRRTVQAGDPVTYAYVTDTHKRLQGLVVLRDLMLAAPNQTINEIMIHQPFYMHPETLITEAMQSMVRRHFPVYPICDQEGRLTGTVKGYLLFEEHAFKLSAQSSRMAGVVKEEMLHTPWLTSLKFRHPWLQLNLLTAFLAATVITLFEDTITQLVLLVAFLPVLAGQSGNTGCQSMAVTLRGMTLGDFKQNSLGPCLKKESILGLANGILVGITAGAAMYAYAWNNDSNSAFLLSVVVFLAMIGSCVISGVTGVIVPTTLKRLGADPATASSIFLTTFTDIASMGLLLWCATAMIL